VGPSGAPNFNRWILKEFELALSELSLSAELNTPYKPLLVFGLKMKKAGSVLTAI
jgi:hypothetical protein